MISVEPIPSTFQSLQKNVRLNDLGRVEPHCCGLSSQRGELSFTAALDTTNRVAAPDDNQPTVRVPVTTLDELLGERTPTLIKIDVAGHELAVLDGGRRTLSSPDVTVILETNRSGERFGVPDQELFGRMGQFGFKPFDYDPYTRCLTPQANHLAKHHFSQECGSDAAHLPGCATIQAGQRRYLTPARLAASSIYRHGKHHSRQSMGHVGGSADNHMKRQRFQQSPLSASPDGADWHSK